MTRTSQTFSLSDLIHSDRSRVIIETAKKVAVMGLKQASGNSFAIKSSVMGILYLAPFNHDTKHVAAYGLVLSTLDYCVFTIVSPIFGVTFGTPTKYKLFLQETDEAEKEIRRIELVSIFKNGFHYAIFGTIAFLPLFFSGSLLKNIFNIDSEIADITQSILRPLSFSVPFIMIGTAARIAVRACGKANIFLYGSAILVTNLLLARAFEFGAFGWPGLGISAFLFFYIFEAIQSCLLYCSYLFFHKDLSALKLLHSFLHPDASHPVSFFDFLKTGASPFIQAVSDLGFWFLMTVMASQFGVPAQAAFALALQPVWFNNLFNMALGISSSVNLGQSIADKTHVNLSLRDIGTAGIITTTAIGSIAPILVSCIPQLLFGVFNIQDQDVISSFNMIRFYTAMASIADSANYPMMFQSRETGDFRYSTIAGLAGRLIGLLFSYVLAFPLQQGLLGVARGCFIGMIYAVVFSYCVWRNQINTVTDKRNAFFRERPQAIIELVPVVISADP